MPSLRGKNLINAGNFTIQKVKNPGRNQAVNMLTLTS